MKKELITLLSVLALAFAFAGCGGSDGGESAEVTPDSPIEIVGNDSSNVGDTNNGAVSANSSANTLKNIEDSVGESVPANPGS